MAALKLFLHKLRWYQWLLAALVLLYLVYIALAYLYVPGKLQDVVQNDVAELIGRDIQVQRIAFDPFGLALEVEGFSIADAPERPLLAWQRFYINLELWKSLFNWQLRLAQVDLEQPRIHIERRPEEFNFTSILERFPAGEEEPADAPEEKTTFAIQVDDINIRDGEFTLDDISGAKPAHSRLDQVTLNVHNLYLATGANDLNPFTLQAAMPGGGVLDLNGEYRIDPLLVIGDVALTDIALATFADFVENVIPLRVNDGTVSLRASVNVEQGDALDVWVKQGELQLRNLALDDAQPEPPLARVAQLDVNGFELDLRQQSVVIDSLTVDGLNLHQWIENDGTIRYQHLLVEKTIEANEALNQPEEESAPWSFLLKDTRINNGVVSFTDMQNGLDATQYLRDIDLHVQNISLNEGEQVPLQLRTTVNDSGTLSVDGNLVLVPFSAELQYQLAQLSLQPFNAYVEKDTWLSLKDGTLSVDGHVKMESGDDLPLTLGMNIQVADVQANDTRNGKPVLQWKMLDVKQLQLDLQKNSLQIDTVQLQQPEIAAAIGADQQMNLATLTKDAPAANSNSSNNSNNNKSADENPMRINVNTVSISGGTTHFQDDSVKPAFKTALHDMKLQMKQLSSDGPQPATFEFSSKIDKYAPFDAKGTLAPLNQQPGFAFSSQLRGLEMPHLSPYTGTYIGYQLRSGQLELDLDYALAKRQLKGSNNIVARQLYLGDTVASEQAVSAPVALGLALLRDLNGVIDLDVGVAGDLDEPGFSVAGVVMKALMNVLVKAAASPFQLLGSLVGGGEEMGKLTFAAGSSELNADEQTQLTQLAQALTQRPQIAVDVRGNASASDDGEALQLIRVRDAIAARRKLAPANLALETLLDERRNRDALEDLNAALELPSVRERRNALLAADPALEGQDLTARIHQQMLQDVARRQPLADEDLLALADQRALIIKQFLVENAGLAHDRVRVKKTVRGDLGGRVSELGLIAE